MPDARLRNEIWLADLLTAWHECGAATLAERLSIAELLGFAETSGSTPAGPTGTQTASESRARPVVRRSLRAQRAETVPSDSVLPLIVVERETATAERSPGSGEGPAMPLETAAHIRYEPPLQPLFEPQYERQILYALSATAAAEGEVEIGPLIEAVARGEPLKNVPRRPVPTLRRGVQLLLDRGEGMMLFFADQKALLHAVRRLVTPERLQVLHFDGIPARAGAGRRSRWRVYQPPPARTKVIAVSDFGIGADTVPGRSAAAGKWLAFAEQLRASDCALIGLVPYPPDRWPAALSGAVKLVQWDRPVRYSGVRQTTLGDPSS